MKKLFVLIAAACMTCTAAFAQTVKPFKEGERAVFLGNSITDGGHYHSYIWLYYMTRFPDMPIRVFNGGIGGDTAYDMNKRLDGDIFAMKPSVLMVTFGMNDSGYFEYNGDKPKEFGEQKYQESIKNYQQMEKRFKDLPDTRIVMVGTSPYDETVQLKENTPFKTKNETIKRLVEYQKESAAKNSAESRTFYDAACEQVSKRYGHAVWCARLSALLRKELKVFHKLTDAALNGRCCRSTGNYGRPEGARELQASSRPQVASFICRVKAASLDLRAWSSLRFSLMRRT